MRRIFAVLAAAAVAAAGAVVLGEYAFGGVAVVLAGLLLGLFVAEAAGTVAREPSRALAAAVGAITALGLVWAAWIGSGHRLGAIGGGGWVAATIGGMAATLRVIWWRTPGRSSDATAPAD